MAKFEIQVSHVLIRQNTRSYAVATTRLSIKLSATEIVRLANLGCWTKILKMLKRKTSFNLEWAKEHRFVTKSRKDELNFFCTLCRSDVDVSSKGKAAIDRHASADKHRANNRNAAGASSLSSFFPEPNHHTMTKSLLQNLLKFIMPLNTTTHTEV